MNAFALGRLPAHVAERNLSTPHGTSSLHTSLLPLAPVFSLFPEWWLSRRLALSPSSTLLSSVSSLFPKRQLSHRLAFLLASSLSGLLPLPPNGSSAAVSPSSFLLVASLPNLLSLPQMPA
ncbi:hypothetical protein AMTR_s00124p00094110 [Amborella trichopoda]|uniref:Uncharacterized protein n=1 Tax=Amborella trichopoda TaxID=13333 RepID=W1NNR4_AMBTC|nr:hypothetical protein AMTR_s00124p00094110 [Amborella trichopoda]